VPWLGEAPPPSRTPGTRDPPLPRHAPAACCFSFRVFVPPLILFWGSGSGSQFVTVHSRQWQLWMLAGSFPWIALATAGSAALWDRLVSLCTQVLPLLPLWGWGGVSVCVWCMSLASVLTPTGFAPCAAILCGALASAGAQQLTQNWCGPWGMTN
jgi:hypothetical protein